MPPASRILEETLRALLAQEGRLTFAQFMATVLYLPGAGYYTSCRSPIGPGGDYYTSPAIHPAFGVLLACQLEEMWRRLGSPSTFWAVELGAGQGRLAQDISGFAPNLDPGFVSALRYLCVDRGALAPLPGLQSLRASGVPLRNLVGCVLSNELLDAFPVHRVAVREGRLQESYVTLGQGGKLAEVWGEPSTPALEQHLRRARVELPEGCEGEIRPSLAPWIGEVGRALERGFILTVDYGGLAQELYGSHRPRGALLCHYRHTVHEDPFAHLGEQDITAPVDFTTLVLAGEEAGLAPLGLVSQGRFLQNLGLEEYRRALSRRGLPPGEHEANQMSLRDLALPEGMGNFRVLIQGKGVSTAPLLGLVPSQLQWERLGGLPLPSLEAERAFLLQGRYPHLAQPWVETFQTPRKSD